jgi:hypothetical protein
LLLHRERRVRLAYAISGKGPLLVRAMITEAQMRASVRHSRRS